MMQIALNESTAALRRLPVYLVDETDGVTPETGITFASGDIKVSENGAAQANHAGSVTEVGLGLYYYVCDTTEVDTEGFLSIVFTKTGVRTFHAMAQVRASSTTPPSAASVADAVWDEARAGHVTAGTFGEAVASVDATVTPDTVDGQTWAVMMEDVMAVLYGVTTRPDATSVAFKKISDGTTTTRTVAYGDDGERLTST